MDSGKTWGNMPRWDCGVGCVDAEQSQSGLHCVTTQRQPGDSYTITAGRKDGASVLEQSFSRKSPGASDADMSTPWLSRIPHTEAVWAGRFHCYHDRDVATMHTGSPDCSQLSLRTTPDLASTEGRRPEHQSRDLQSWFSSELTRPSLCVVPARADGGHCAALGPCVLRGLGFCRCGSMRLNPHG